MQVPYQTVDNTKHPFESSVPALNHKNQKHGKYYSSIPNRFKEIAYKKFDNYCLRLK